MTLGDIAGGAPVRRKRGTRALFIGGAQRSALSWASALAPAIALAFVWLVVLIAIALTTLIVALTGGAPNPLVHLYYLPILYAAVRNGVAGALSAAVIAGLAAGPLMPTPSGTSQHFMDWGVRLLLFVVVGGVAAWLARQQPRPLEVMVRDILMGRALRQALRLDELHVHYQPIVNLGTGAVVGVEALARWTDHRGKIVPPLSFIPAAERTGTIGPLGARVLERAVEQARSWSTAEAPGLILAVNVSAVQLCDPGFEAQLRTAVGASGAQGFHLCLEITETALMGDPERARRTLDVARSLGITVALDDFGTGHSSLAYLLSFPITVIKIDRAFVSALENDPKALALVKAVHQMAESLGAITVAEGIENPRQLAILREVGCHMAQGYYLGMPSRPQGVDWSLRKLALKASRAHP